MNLRGQSEPEITAVLIAPDRELAQKFLNTLSGPGFPASGAADNSSNPPGSGKTGGR